MMTSDLINELRTKMDALGDMPVRIIAMEGPVLEEFLRFVERSRGVKITVKRIAKEPA